MWKQGDIQSKKQETQTGIRGRDRGRDECARTETKQNLTEEGKGLAESVTCSSFHLAFAEGRFSLLYHHFDITQPYFLEIWFFTENKYGFQITRCFYNWKKKKKGWFLSLKYVLLGLIKNWIKSFERKPQQQPLPPIFFFSLQKRIHSVSPDSLKQIGIVSTSSLLTFIFEWSFLSSNKKLFLRFFGISCVFQELIFLKGCFQTIINRYWETSISSFLRHFIQWNKNWRNPKFRMNPHFYNFLVIWP